MAPSSARNLLVACRVPKSTTRTAAPRNLEASSIRTATAHPSPTATAAEHNNSSISTQKIQPPPICAPRIPPLSTGRKKYARSMIQTRDVYCVCGVNYHSRIKLQNKEPTPLQQIPKVLLADTDISLTTYRLAPGPTPQPLQIAGNESSLSPQYQAKDWPRRHFPKEPESRLTHVVNFRNRKNSVRAIGHHTTLVLEICYYHAQTRIPIYARTACSTLINVRTSAFPTLLRDFLSH